ncbi:hypothetical protein CHCC20335_1440 [Bacillus paralicheniformis]|nr:hypothetical protein CHCC20335_1440 [Bacillus paralicheniformis]
MEHATSCITSCFFMVIALSVYERKRLHVPEKKCQLCQMN